MPTIKRAAILNQNIQTLRLCLLIPFHSMLILTSKQNDPVHFSSNVEKLKSLSHKSRCTKSYNAEPYLSKGDFHIYIENDEPKLGVRFEND